MIDSGKAAFLCGADLSSPSGLPWTVPLKIFCLFFLLSSSKDQVFPAEWLPGFNQPDPPLGPCLKRMSARNHFPEVILEKMILQPPLETLLEIFEQAEMGEALLDLFEVEEYRPVLEPNAYHRFLAKLIAQGRLRTVVTLSFDRLLEKALQQEGLAAGKDFEVLFREEDLKGIDWGQEKVRLLMLNGSLEDRWALKKGLPRFPGMDSGKIRRKILSDLFSDRLHQQVVLFEPGGSDLAALYPFFEFQSSQDKKILHLCHSEVLVLEELERKGKKGPLIPFSGILRLRCPGPLLLEKLGQVFSFTDLPSGKREIPWVEKAIRRLREVEKPLKKNTVLGLWLSKVGEHALAIEYLERILKTAQSVEDSQAQVVILNGLGSSYSSLNEYPEAVEYFEQALRAASFAGDPEGQAFSLAHLGSVCFTLGEYHEALDYHEQLLHLSRSLKDPNLESRALMGLGALCLQLKKYPRAVECFEQALTLAEKQTDPKAEADCLAFLGSVYQATGEYHRAVGYFSRTLHLDKSNGDPPALKSHLIQLGNAYHGLGEYHAAIGCFEQALSLARKQGDQEGEGMILANLGTSLADSGKYTEALVHYLPALELAEKQGPKETAGILLANIGAAYSELKDYEKAVSYYERALTFKRALGEKEEEGILLGRLGTAYLHNGEKGRALKCFHKALDILQNFLAPNHLFIKTIEKHIAKTKAVLDPFHLPSSPEAQNRSS